MQTTPPPLPIPRAPWTARDSWYGAGFLVVWVALNTGFQYLNYQFSWNVDIGVFTIATEVALLLPVWIFGIRKNKFGWSDLGLRRFSARFLALALGLLYLNSLFNAFYTAVVLIPLNQTLQSDLKLLLSQTFRSIWVWIGVVIAAPLCEELFFRGFLFMGFRKSLNWIVAAVFSAAIFSIFHFDLYAIPPIFVMGFLSAFLVQKSQSLWPSILMHMCINLSTMIVIALNEFLSKLV